MMSTQPTFGRRLRQLRQQRGKTQADLAGPGMSAAYLSRLESGTRPPTERALAYLAERLNVQISDFQTTEPTDLVDVLATVLVSGGEDTRSERYQLEEALNHAKPVDPALRWQAYAQLSKLMSAQGDRGAELDVVETLTSLSDELGHATLQLHSRLRLARCLRALGQAERARAVALEALELAARAALANRETVRCQLLLASATAELGDLAEAARLSSEICEELATATGTLAAEAYWTAATVATRQGHHARSAELLERALAALDSRDDLTLWMRLRLAAAALALQALPPDLTKAENYLDQVRPALDLIGEPLHVQEYTFLRAQLAYAQGDLDRASTLCEQTQQANSKLTFRDGVRLRMLQLQVRTSQGDPAAISELQSLASEVHSCGMLDLAAEVWRAAAESRAPGGR
ncbi:helix-turn-helix domain-containing protein [Kitasatospora cineracea]|uniref:helix-turn-helix domain-containing protein n=1 Tax=Kitasatospora cineracea TaxID=88074 RepID=UPI0034043D13